MTYLHGASTTQNSPNHQIHTKKRKLFKIIGSLALLHEILNRDIEDTPEEKR